MSNIKIAIAYHSGYGHTEKVAHSILAGVKDDIEHANLVNVANLSESDWNILDEADGIIFGAPTYMGGISGQFKSFLDSTSGRWMHKKWLNKFAAGFTNSSALSGDKLNSLNQLVITAMQHGMIWIGFDAPAPSKTGTDVPSINEINRLGSWLGLMTQSNNDKPEITPSGGDLETAKLFGHRVVNVIKNCRK